MVLTGCVSNRLNFKKFLGFSFYSLTRIDFDWKHISGDISIEGYVTRTEDIAKNGC